METDSWYDERLARQGRGGNGAAAAPAGVASRLVDTGAISSAAGAAVGTKWLLVSCLTAAALVAGYATLAPRAHQAEPLPTKARSATVAPRAHVATNAANATVPRLKGFVINLARRTDRRAAAQAELNNSWPTLDYEFFEAIANMQDHKMGCRWSHFRALQWYLEHDSSKYDAVVIMEDDLRITKPIEKELTQIPSQWDMMLVSYRPVHVKRVNSEPHWYRAVHGWSMLSYIVSNKFLPYYIGKVKQALEHPVPGNVRDHLHGFEHISMLGEREASQFMADNMIMVPEVLWARPSLAFHSDLDPHPPTAAKLQDYVKRVHWTTELTDSRLTIDR